MDRLIEVVNSPLFLIGDRPVSLTTIAIALAIVLLTVLVSRGARRASSAAFRRRGVTEEGTILAVNRLVHYIVLFVGLGIAVQTAGIDLGALFAAGAVFAVGIGFAMQNIAQNFVSGVILLFEQAIKPGDVLEINGKLVRVRKMGIRVTVVRARDGEDVIVPNAEIVQGTVVNYTQSDSRFRVRVVVGVAYHEDMRNVRATLEKAAETFAATVAEDRELAEKPVEVWLKDFGSSSVDWEIGVWAADPWHVLRHQSALRETIWSAFADEGIVIAFPQVDVHLDTPVANGLAALANAGATRS